MSKRIFILAPYPQGEAPSQRFRFEQYLDALEKDGYSIEFHPFLNDRTWKALYREGNFFAKAFGVLGSFFRRFLLLFKIPKADFVFIHREAAMIGPPVFEWIIAKVLRKKYIYDFDDAIWLPNYSETNARFHRLKAYGKIKRIIRWAGKVSAGNDYLKDYARQFNANVVVIPTTIDLKNVHNVRSTQDQDPPNIVWTGSHTTMRYLDEFIPILKELEKDHSFHFTIISNQAPQYDLQSLRFVKWTRETEISGLAEGSIGVMPMVKDEWSEGKCGFKGLQYMALGIPALMSPVGVNTSIVQDGVNGYLCSTPEDWKRRITELLNDRELRLEIGKKGFETVERNFSVKSQLPKYQELFSV